jgi:tRNA (cytidine/uridine-2'-O-)-methyltransferase
MFHVILYQPEIPPNTGNVMRLCANTGTRLHLIEPLGFELEDKALRRAGLDYREWADVRTYPTLDSCVSAIKPHRLYAFSTHAARAHASVAFASNDAFVFGPETRGLPTDLLNSLPEDRRLRIPMHPGNRSLNLANAVSIAVYEAWRQLGFEGGK